MTVKQIHTIKQYPRIAAALLAVAADTDTNWAAGVIDAAKNGKSAMSISLIREAYRKRHTFKSTEGERAVNLVVESTKDAA